MPPNIPGISHKSLIKRNHLAHAHFLAVLDRYLDTS